MVLLPMLWAIILGIIGGVANSLLLEDGFALPFVVVKEHPQKLENRRKP